MKVFNETDVYIVEGQQINFRNKDRYYLFCIEQLSRHLSEDFRNEHHWKYIALLNHLFANVLHFSQFTSKISWNTFYLSHLFPSKTLQKAFRYHHKDVWSYFEWKWKFSFFVIFDDFSLVFDSTSNSRSRHTDLPCLKPWDL